MYRSESRDRALFEPQQIAGIFDSTVNRAILQGESYVQRNFLSARLYPPFAALSIEMNLLLRSDCFCASNAISSGLMIRGRQEIFSCDDADDPSL